MKFFLHTYYSFYVFDEIKLKALNKTVGKAKNSQKVQK